MQGRNPIIFDWFVCHGCVVESLWKTLFFATAPNAVEPCLFDYGLRCRETDF
jgi:hypothetical protein